MKIHFLFSRNRKVGSRLIAWAAQFERTELPQTPSHVAVLVDETWVFESTLGSGVRIVPYEKWLELNELMYFVKFDHNMNSEDVLRRLASLWGRPYDWGGILFFAWRYLGLIVLGRPLPHKNRWQSRGAYFCTEYVSVLTGQDYGMKSPAKVCEEVLKLRSAM